AISSVSVVPMPEVNSSPRKLTAPRGLFETVSNEQWVTALQVTVGLCGRLRIAHATMQWAELKADCS
ncbi:hypothetical protein, partial [Burkholderia vietnamiensis]|uniref:hypothetical protein n=1 Tax=Burkholderia vietnamiensis TaxID=60552 RepID=UPI001ABA3738